MRSYDVVYLVYGQKSSHQDSSYYAFQIFSEAAPIEKEQVLKSYESTVDIIRGEENLNMVGPFKAIDNLQRFSFDLCQRLNAKKIALLNINAYNEAVEKSAKISELWENLQAGADLLENTQVDQGKGFFNRIFH